MVFDQYFIDDLKMRAAILRFSLTQNGIRRKI